MGRKQRVCLQHCHSQWSNVTSGVPQGSILGPLLFIIYINDIGSNIESKARLFADDCVLYREVRSTSDSKTLQNDLDKLAKWSNTWQLKFNVTKCKIMRISNQKTIPIVNYYLNNTMLEWVQTFKYLGLVIDRKLTWRDQVNHATSKATKILNLLKRNMHHSSKLAKSRAFTALVLPHLEFSVAVWSPHLKKDKTRLENVQKRAARWIEAKWSKDHHCWNKSYDECLLSLSWLTLENRRTLHSCCQTYKILHNMDCLNFKDHYQHSNLRTRSHNQSLLYKHSRVNYYRVIPFL